MCRANSRATAPSTTRRVFAASTLDKLRDAMAAIGLTTLPVGLNVFVLKGVAPDVSMGNIFRGSGWFSFVDIIYVAITLLISTIMIKYQGDD